VVCPAEAIDSHYLFKKSLRSPQLLDRSESDAIEESFGQDGSGADLAPSRLREEDVIFQHDYLAKGK
jgi:hypothetical protein